VFESETFHARLRPDDERYPGKSDGAARAPTGEVHIRDSTANSRTTSTAFRFLLGFGGLNEVVDPKSSTASHLSPEFSCGIRRTNVCHHRPYNRVPTAHSTRRVTYAGSYLVSTGQAISPGTSTAAATRSAAESVRSASTLMERTFLSATTSEIWAFLPGLARRPTAVSIRRPRYFKRPWLIFPLWKIRLRPQRQRIPDRKP